MTSLRKEKLTFIDATILKAINLHELMPIEVDDELILEDRILYQPQGEVSLATAFNLHSLTFWAAITSTSTSRNDRPASKEHCACTLYTSTDLHIAHLTERLQDTKNILDGIPRQLRQWGARIKNNLPNHLNSAEQEEQRVKEEQLESLRADLHVTHLWLQSIIFERIEALKQSSVAGSSSTSAAVWNEREHICRQMLHLLNNISNEHLEPNGNHLVSSQQPSRLACMNTEINRRTKFVMSLALCLAHRLRQSTMSQRGPRNIYKSSPISCHVWMVVIV